MRLSTVAGQVGNKVKPRIYGSIFVLLGQSNEG